MADELLPVLTRRVRETLVTAPVVLSLRTIWHHHPEVVYHAGTSVLRPGDVDWDRGLWVTSDRRHAEAYGDPAVTEIVLRPTLLVLDIVSYTGGMLGPRSIGSLMSAALHAAAARDAALVLASRRPWVAVLRSPACAAEFRVA